MIDKFKTIKIEDSAYYKIESSIKNKLTEMDKKNYELLNITSFNDSIILIFKQKEIEEDIEEDMGFPV